MDKLQAVLRSMMHADSHEYKSLSTIDMNSALPISRGHLHPNNSWKASIARPLGRGMGFFRELEL